MGLQILLQTLLFFYTKNYYITSTCLHQYEPHHIRPHDASPLLVHRAQCTSMVRPLLQVFQASRMLLRCCVAFRKLISYSMTTPLLLHLAHPSFMGRPPPPLSIKHQGCRRFLRRIPPWLPLFAKIPNI
jgi:hypothetical protein